MKKYGVSWLGIKSLLVTLVAFLLLCAQSTFAAEPINVCVTSDFSGVTASIGILQTKIIEMVVKDVNDAGGIKGRPIKLIIQDNASDPSKALGNVKMFKDQYKCKVMLVDITSSVVLALKGWAEANKIPMVTGAPQTEKLTEMNKKSWIFRTCSPASLNSRAALAGLKKRGYTKVAFEGSTLAWGTDTLAQIKEYAPQYGIQIIHETLTEPKTKDLSIQVKKMKDSGAEAVIFAEYEAETAVLARAMSALGWKPFVMSTSPANLKSTINLGSPELYEGWETVTNSDPTKPLVKKVWKQASAFIGKPVDEDEKAIRAYDQVSALVEALKVAKNLDDSASIRDAFYNISPNWLHGTGRVGSKGPFTTAKNHLLDVSEMVHLVVKNGQLVPSK